MDIGEKIKHLRKLHGLTLEQVGQIVGVGKSTVRKWEEGNIKNMRWNRIAGLAKALHTTPAYLMDWTDEISLRNNHGEELLDFDGKINFLVEADLESGIISVSKNGSEIILTANEALLIAESLIHQVQLLYKK